MADENCPLCKLKLIQFMERPDNADKNFYECHNCGSFFVVRSVVSRLNNLQDWGKAGLSHEVWRHRFDPDFLTLGSHKIDKVYWEDLLEPEEQLENLILFWGEKQDKNIGGRLNLKASHLRAKIGSLNAEGVNYVAGEAIERKLLDGQVDGGNVKGKLSFKGWRIYRNLERGNTRSHQAFMAMPFGFPRITQFVDEVLRPAVAETGFTLKRLDDEPRSGLIDERLRFEIRQSKFVIVDLTEENRGAYWEAGFAEGLSKPVFYTCERRYFDENSTHFDTNHQGTVLWDAEEPSNAAEELKASIRNTFPFDAKMPPEQRD